MSSITDAFHRGFWRGMNPRNHRSHATGETVEYATCPECSDETVVWPEERERDRCRCLYCTAEFRLSDGTVYPHDLGADEPEWAEPSEAERAWAKATMPGRAEGHTIAWRTWSVSHRTPTTSIDDLTTEALLDQTPTQAMNTLTRALTEVETARGSPRWWLRSINLVDWPHDEPMIATRAPHMPRAHGAGVYAAKDPRRLDYGDVIGQVALWGAVAEHERGYRARFAYPVRLWVDNHIFDEKDARGLSEAYGVPCTRGLPDEIDEKKWAADRHSTMMSRSLRQAMLTPSMMAGLYRAARP